MSYLCLLLKNLPKERFLSKLFYAQGAFNWRESSVSHSERRKTSRVKIGAQVAAVYSIFDIFHFLCLTRDNSGSPSF